MWRPSALAGPRTADRIAESGNAVLYRQARGRAAYGFFTTLFQRGQLHIKVGRCQAKIPLVSASASLMCAPVFQRVVKAFCGAEKARNGEGRSPPGPAGTAGIHHAARPSGAAPARLDSLWQPATVWQMPADKGRVMTWSFLLFLWQ